jgi:RNA polymerase sigma-70 factor (ECF subfamily)
MLLSPQSRRIFEMSRIDNKKNREIADELNISIKTVEAGITKVLKLLRLALKQYLPIVFF